MRDAEPSPHIGSIAAGLGARTVESVADVTVSHAMGMVMIDVYHLKEQSSFDQYSAVINVK